MKAWQSHGKGVDNVSLETVPVPSPGPGSALIEVQYAALNFSDLLMLDDRYQVRPTRPFIPGQEVAGTVVESGPESRLVPGDRVASKVEWGAFAPWAVVRDDMAMVFDESTDLASAVALPVAYTTAWVGLVEQAGLTSGETLLVHGASGGVGLAAVEIGKVRGAQVIATASTASKRELARAHGADAVVDYTEEGWVEAVQEASGGHGVDVVFDPVGGLVGEQSLKCLAWDGRFLVVGFASGSVPKLPAHRLLLQRLQAIGVYWSHDRDREMLERVGLSIRDLLEQGSIRPHLDRTCTLDELPKALTSLGDRSAKGKVVLSITGDGS
jgi:NADPH2:quinone reductase